MASVRVDPTPTAREIEFHRLNQANRPPKTTGVAVSAVIRPPDPGRASNCHCISTCPCICTSPKN